MNNFLLMAQYNAWINERIYGAVAGLDDAAYRLDRGAYFGSIHHTLNHLLVVDRLFAARLVGQTPDIVSLDQMLYDDFDSLRAAREAEDRLLIDLLESWGEDDLQAPIRFKRILGSGEHEMQRDHMLLTLFNHQTHHRGQVHCMLTQAGIDPPPIDVIEYFSEIGLS